MSGHGSPEEILQQKEMWLQASVAATFVRRTRRRAAGRGPRRACASRTWRTLT
jgi:hypothetical protein